MPAKKHLLNALKILVLSVASFYIFTKFWQNLTDLKQIHFRIENFALLIVSFALCMVFFGIKVSNWHFILIRFQPSMRYVDSARIWFGSQTIKYIPGKIWFLLGRFYLGQHLLTKPVIFITSFIEILLMLVSGTLIFFVFGDLVNLIHLTGILRTGYVIIFAVVLALAAIHPFFLNIYQNVLARLFKQPKVRIELTFTSLLLLLLAYCANWILFGISSYLIIISFFELHVAFWGQVVGIFAISYVVGFLSLLTPGGIGVRESVQVYFLSGLMPESITALIAIVSRLFWVTCEIIGAAIFVGLRKVLSMRRDKSSTG
ncbi:flippase-like domain-containing protein [candidate division KSB1 bacterium]|nr:flippase-like domain-containing protein [candidate division KSB1 bacterium]